MYCTRWYLFWNNWWYKKLLETKTEVWGHIWIFGPDPTPCPGAAEVPRRWWTQLGNSVGNLQKWANNVKKCYFTIANLPWLRMRGAAPVLMSASMSPYSTVTGTSAAQAITLLSWSLSCQDYSAAITSSSPSLRHVGHVWQCFTILLWEDSMIIDRQTNCLHIKLCNYLHRTPQHRYRQTIAK